MRKSDLESLRDLREPLRHLRGYDLYVTSASLGLQFLMVLNVARSYNLSAMSWDDPLAIHHSPAGTQFSASIGRAYISDPEFHDLPYEAFAGKVRKDQTDVDQSGKSFDQPYASYLGDASPFADGSTYEEVLLEELAPVMSSARAVEESPSTTHFSIVDKER